MYKNLSYYVSREYRECFLEHCKDTGVNLNYATGSLIESDFTCKDYCYLILQGKAKQYFINPEGKQRIVLILGVGDFFGEVNMLQNNIDLVVTEAITDCCIKKIKRLEFEKLIASNADFALKFIQMQSTKSRIFLFQIHDASYLEVKERLKNLLIRLGIQHGIRYENMLLIDFQLNHEDLAQMIGSSRSTVTKILAELIDEGLIVNKNRKIYLTQGC